MPHLVSIRLPPQRQQPAVPTVGSHSPAGPGTQLSKAWCITPAGSSGALNSTPRPCQLRSPIDLVPTMPSHMSRTSPPPGNEPVRWASRATQAQPLVLRHSVTSTLFDSSPTYLLLRFRGLLPGPGTSAFHENRRRLSHFRNTRLSTFRPRLPQHHGVAPLVHHVGHRHLAPAVVPRAVSVFNLGTPGNAPSDADGAAARLITASPGPPAPRTTTPLREPFF